ncbi:MAG: cytochrome c peroxidase [Flavobacteriaceae bacterium]|jgi:cytochrome c peroxidase|uniref:cytochrome c peroxidase n=1 Tax=Candidatus Marifrigoribacter sp. Uisw_064 TaxID=3230970 RepID=UPI003AE3851A
MKIKFAFLSISIIVLCLFVSATIDLDNLFNYENQTIPNYINKDNTTTNPITDEVATLGRVLFYDANLSSNQTIACASCHQQDKAFGDSEVQSIGLEGGLTGRHSMRLINARFAIETHFFWDERATTLEEQTTMPIQDHIEMGYSGTNGDPDINDLILELEELDYYQTLFEFAYGDSEITEERMQLALAQFIRSIQSFDSRFDEGLTQVNNINQDFPNYSAQENLGKDLFIAPPNGGGAGCIGCHQGPEFDIDPNTLNNGILLVAGSDTEIDLTNTRAPSLRDLMNPDGTLNGPLMHNGNLTTLLQVVNHYNQMPNNPDNTNLDPRLRGPGGQPQNLNLTENEKAAIVAFLETLTGVDVYTNEKWSDPFDENGEITIIGGNLSTEENDFGTNVTLYPNPVIENLTVSISDGNYSLNIFNLLGQKLHSETMTSNIEINLSNLNSGIYVVSIQDVTNQKSYSEKIIKR